MACWEGKTYKLDKSENFDEYMKTLGVGMVMRKFGNTLTPTVQLLKNGDDYTLVTASTVRTTTIQFVAGVEFENETIDGRKVLTTITFETPNKLVQVEGGDKPGTITREFTDTELIVTCECNGVIATRYYKVV